MLYVIGYYEWIFSWDQETMTRACHGNNLLHNAVSLTKRTNIQMVGLSVISNAITPRSYMVTSCHGHVSHLTGPLWAKSTGHRWIPSIAKGQSRGFIVFSCMWHHYYISCGDRNDISPHALLVSILSNIKTWHRKLYFFVIWAKNKIDKCPIAMGHIHEFSWTAWSKPVRNMLHTNMSFRWLRTCSCDLKTSSISAHSSWYQFVRIFRFGPGNSYIFFCP